MHLPTNHANQLKIFHPTNEFTPHDPVDSDDMPGQADPDDPLPTVLFAACIRGNAVILIDYYFVNVFISDVCIFRVLNQVRKTGWYLALVN